MANRWPCVGCDSMFEENGLECSECGHLLYCSIKCTFKTEHPCLLLRILLWHVNDDQNGPKLSPRIQLLTRLQKKCLGRLYECNGLSRTSIHLLLENQIPGPAFECLFQIAAIVDVWPHMALERTQWIQKMAKLLFTWQPRIDETSFTRLAKWSEWPDLFVPLFRTFQDKNADLFLAKFDANFTWKYVFADAETFDFLHAIMQKAATIPLPLQKSICSLRISRGRGLDLAVFGRYIQLPLICANYDQACVVARKIRPPPGMYFVFDRSRWEKARKIYIDWLGHRDHLFYIFSIASYTKLPTLLDYSWLGL